MKKNIFVILTFTLFLIPARATLAKPNTLAKQVMMIDATTGKVLFEKNAHQLMHPSSMTKVMLCYLVFKHLKDGHIRLDQKIPVSELAWKKRGSRMFIEVGSKVTIEDLLRGIIVQSGNDASTAIAEFLYGNEEVCSGEMTSVAQDMGAKDTTFTNVTGWPTPVHLSTARDLVFITDRLIKDFPEYYHYFKEKEFTYNNIRQINRNPLLHRKLGPGIQCDGVKTGNTSVGQYGLIASAIHQGQRFILVINGLKTKEDRARESEKLIQWGVRNFKTLQLFKKGEAVHVANVWGGDKGSIPMTLAQDLFITVPQKHIHNMQIEVSYSEPIPAPFKAGDKVGEVIVKTPDEDPVRIDLLADKKVRKANFFKRIQMALYYLIWGHSDPDPHH